MQRNNFLFLFHVFYFSVFSYDEFIWCTIIGRMTLLINKRNNFFKVINPDTRGMDLERENKLMLQEQCVIYIILMFLMSCFMFTMSLATKNGREFLCDFLVFLFIYFFFFLVKSHQKLPKNLLKEGRKIQNCQNFCN